MPPYEITRIVRASGFDPLAPPLREGTTYVLRATDFRGILMRIVVDARSGAIRAVNRVVPPDYPGGPIGMMPPYGVPAYAAQPYGPPPYGRPPYGALPPDGLPNVAGQEIAPGEGTTVSPAPVMPAAPMPAAPLRTASHPAVTAFPPLPRPRPPELAARQGDNASSTGKASAAPLTPAAAKGDVKSGIAAPAAPAAANKPAQVPIND